MHLSDKHIHIIAFNVPYPANYGGVIDVYYKIKALHALGVKVHLHCYKYGRDEAPELKKICHKVTYYKRHIYKDPLFTRLPYIVATRNTAELLENLLKDKHPILFEGMHCCYYLDHPDLADRFKVVRMHNLEHVYYKNLAKVERNLFKRYFFEKEAERLKKFEKVLRHANAIAAISPDDTQILSLKYDNVFYLPAFHANTEVTAPLGKGKFALYHGNLGVGENNEAALYLVKEVFSKLEYPFVIAGMNPSRELQRAIEEYPHMRLETKLDTEGIMKLISEAHINVLPTFQSTGMKLKLLNVLYLGRHIVVNTKMVHNTGVEGLCHVADTPARMQAQIKRLATVPFSKTMWQERAELMEEQFSNAKAARILFSQVWKEVAPKNGVNLRPAAKVLSAKSA
jgi:hypothetical protein